MSRLVRIVKLSSTIVPVSVKDTAEPTNHFSAPYCSAALEAILSGAVCAFAGSDLPTFNVGRCVLGEIRKCICVASNGSAGERNAVVAQIAV